MHNFPSTWCWAMINLAAINCQFFFCMFICLWQVPDDSFLIWIDWHHNKPHSSYHWVYRDFFFALLLANEEKEHSISGSMHRSGRYNDFYSSF